MESLFVGERSCESSDCDYVSSGSRSVSPSQGGDKSDKEAAESQRASGSCLIGVDRWAIVARRILDLGLSLASLSSFVVLMAPCSDLSIRQKTVVVTDEFG